MGRARPLSAVLALLVAERGSLLKNPALFWSEAWDLTAGGIRACGSAVQGILRFVT
jgi:hypothetical protein